MNLWQIVVLIGQVVLVLSVTIILIGLVSSFVLSSRISKIEECEQNKLSIEELKNNG